MPPWEAFQPKAQQPSAAPAPAAGPWQKFQPAATDASPVDPNEGWGPPGMIVPIQFPENGQNGGWPRLAMPQALTDMQHGIESVTKAATGGYGMEIDPATGRPTTITNGMIGDAMNAASMGLTPLSPAAAAGARFGQGAISGPARRLVQREMTRAGIDPAEVPSIMRSMGPNTMVADLSPGLQARAAAIATMPGSGQKTIVDALSARRAGANVRIQTGVNDVLGPAPIPSYLQADITANKKALSPYYKEVLSGPDVRAVDTKPLADTLDAMIINERGASQSVASTVRKMLNLSGEGSILDPSPETVLATRQAVGGMLAKAESAIEKDPTQIGALKHIYGQLDELLTNSVPGIKDVDAQYQELARQSGAIDTGGTILSNADDALRPQEVQDLMSGGGPQYSRTADGGPVPKGTLVGPSAVPLRLSQGARAKIDQIVGTNTNDINAMKKIVQGEGNWNRDRLVSVFGPEKTAALLDIFEQEARQHATEQLALQGSRTQVLKAAQEDIVGKGPRANPVRSLLNLRVGDALADTADRAFGWVGDAKRGGTNAQIAEALIAKGGDPMVSTISRRPPGMTEKSWMNLVRALAQQPDYIAGGAGQLSGGSQAVVEALRGPRRQ